jgi:hypothetical protein
MILDKILLFLILASAASIFRTETSTSTSTKTITSTTKTSKPNSSTITTTTTSKPNSSKITSTTSKSTTSTITSTTSKTTSSKITTTTTTTTKATSSTSLRKLIQNFNFLNFFMFVFLKIKLFVVVQLVQKVLIVNFYLYRHAFHAVSIIFSVLMVYASKLYIFSIYIHYLLLNIFKSCPVNTTWNDGDQCS